MPKLSISKINDIPKLAKSTLAASPVRDVALHEAAHLVAALACRGLVIYVWVSPGEPGRRLPGAFYRRSPQASGVCGADSSHPDLDAFIRLVGHAWEEAHGDVGYAAHDFKCFKPHRAWVLDEARDFVKRHDRQIRHAAAGILLLSDANGVLDGKRLQALIKWLLSKIPHKFSRYQTGQLKNDEPW